jgi:septum formation inhibitor MinC
VLLTAGLGALLSGQDGAMPKPTKRAPVKSSSKTKTKTKAANTARPTKKAQPTPSDEAAYLEMLIKTGQAAPAGRRMPAGATHVVVTDDTGKAKAVRRRFSIG